MPENKAVRRKVNWSAVTIVAALSMPMALMLLHSRQLDGLDGWLFGMMLTEDTVYAAGYSDAAFRRVKAGMTADTVVSILGEPLRIRTDLFPFRTRAVEMSDECWAYTVSPGNTDYRQRRIFFSNGIVSVKESSIWVD